MRVTSTSPAGNLALSLSADGIVPVSRSVTIFSASVFPHARDLLRTARARASSSTDAPVSRIAFAALRYATTRWTIAPSSSYRSASSANASAISALRTGI